MFMGVATVRTPHLKVKYGVGGEGWGTTSTVLIVIFFFEISCFHIIGFTDIEKSPPPLQTQGIGGPKTYSIQIFYCVFLWTGFRCSRCGCVFANNYRGCELELGVAEI